jgi:hypothetical protein
MILKPEIIGGHVEYTMKNNNQEEGLKMVPLSFFSFGITKARMSYDKEMPGQILTCFKTRS